MKAIIVYYSHSANNEALAQELKVRLGCDLLKIEEQKKRTGFTILLDLIFKRDAKIKEPNVLLSDYHTVVFISPIWDAQIATPLKTFIKMEREQVKDYAFITVCGGREGQHEKITKQLTALTLKKPIIVTELVANDLLPFDQKNKIKYTTPYRVTEEDFKALKKQIQNFVNTIYEHTSALQVRTPHTKDESFV